MENVEILNQIKSSIERLESKDFGFIFLPWTPKEHLRKVLLMFMNM